MTKYKWFTIFVSTIVLLASSFPTLYFLLYPKDNLTFLKRSHVNSQDVYTYVSFIEQAKEGRNLFENLYTSEPQKPSLIRPSYLLLGKVAQLTNMSSINAYHLGRILFSIIFLFVLYKFLGYFFADEKTKFIAYTLILTSSGLGFLVYKWLPSSIDLWIPEGNTFLSFAEAPHFILSQTLMLAGLTCFLNFIKHKKNSQIILASLFFLALSLEHPFNLVIIAPTLLITAIWSKVLWKNAIFVSILSAIGLIYQYYLTQTNPVLAVWQAQNILLSPPPMTYLFGYGLLLIPGIITIESLLKEEHGVAYKLLLVWIVTTSLLLYSPFNFQRRFVEGLHIPITILATYGLTIFFRIYKLKYQTTITVGLILLFSATSIFMIYTSFNTISQDITDNYYYHIDPSEVIGINWLKANSTTNDTILSNWFAGNLIPGLIGRKVYLGHKIQTTNWDAKNRELDIFVQNISPEVSSKFLTDNKITYIFLGKNDILLQNGFKPENYPSLKSVYQKDGVNIYKVDTK